MKNINKVDNNNIVCIIAEFNPFHLGHFYQIQKIKEELNPKFLVVIMSGSVTQHGDICVAQKHQRANWAISAGVDLVIELPTIYSLSNAKTFAFGAVRILNSIFNNFTLVFGSESKSVEELETVYKMLKDEATNLKIKRNLAKGFSYGKSCELAIDSIDHNFWLPNNILSLEYISAINSINPYINYYPIRRQDEFQSSTYIRKLMSESNDFSSHVPSFVNITKKFDFSTFERLSIFNLNSKNASEISEYLNLTEGFENKIKKQRFNNISEYYSLTSRRITLSNLKRILLSINLGIKKTSLQLINDLPPYTTVLGINDEKKSDILSFCSRGSCNFLYKESDNAIDEYKELIDIDHRADVFLDTLSR